MALGRRAAGARARWAMFATALAGVSCSTVTGLDDFSVVADACGGCPGDAVCVDNGICCDTPCDDACHACDLPGREGTCSPIEALVAVTDESDASCLDTCGKGGCFCGPDGGRLCSGDSLASHSVGSAGSLLVADAIALAAEGDVVLGGTLSGVLETADGMVVAQGNDGVLMKLGSDGAPRWTAFVVSPGNDSVTDVAVAGNGRIFATGTIGATGSYACVTCSKTEMVAVVSDGFVLAVGPQGSHATHIVFGSTGFERANAVAVDAGRVAIAGWGQWTGTAAEGDGSYNAFFGELTRDLVPVAFNVLQPFDAASQFAEGVAIHGDGLVMAGEARGTMTVGRAQIGGGQSHDVMVGRFGGPADAVNPAIWAGSWGDTRDLQYAHAIAVAPDGDVVVAGRFLGELPFAADEPLVATEKTGVDASAADVFVARFRADGGLRWSRSFGGPLGAYLWGAAVDSAGNTIVVGSTYAELQGVPSAIDTAHKSLDAFVLKLSPSGQRLWGRRFESAGADEARDVAIGEADHIFVSGSFQGNVDFGDQAHTAGGSSTHAFVVELLP